MDSEGLMILKQYTEETPTDTYHSETGEKQR